MLPKLNADEIRLRGTLLSNSKELLQLHRTLVRGGLLSEEEFWETRQSSLKSQEVLLKQERPALPSLVDGIFTDKTPKLQNDHRIVLTPETIQAILSHNSLLNRAYRENVPQKLSEKEFWTFYVRSKFFKKSGQRQGTDQEDYNPLNEYYDEDAGEQNSEFISIDSNPVSRLVDIVATSEDHQSDINKGTTSLSRSQGEGLLDLIRKFNNYSTRVVQCTTGLAPPVRIEDSVELEDLTQRQEPIGISIGIKNVAASQAAVDGSTVDESTLNGFIEEASNCGFDPWNFIRANIIGYVDRRELLSGFMKNLNYSPSHAKAESLSPPRDVMIFHCNAAEVLRHFWNCFPPGKDADKKTKLIRMKTILEQFSIKGRELVLNRDSLQGQVIAENTLAPIMETIERAASVYKEHFEHESKKIKTER